MIEISEKLIEKIQNEKSRRIFRISFLLTLLFLMICALVSNVNVKINREYCDFRHIVAYIFEFRDLPNNYVPKSLSGTIVGDDLYLYEIFMNNEGLLPSGGIYISAYYNSTKTYISPERIVFSATDVYFTEDHYESFERVSRFDIYGFHYITLSLFCLLLIGGGMLTLISIRKGYITTEIIKSDIDKDIKFIVKKFKNMIKYIGKYISSIKHKTN